MSHSHTDETVETAANTRKFLTALFLGIFSVLLLLILFRSCNGADTTAATDNIADEKPAASADKASAIPESIKVKLPNGIELDAYKGGIEDKLVAFLMTAYEKLGEDSLKKIWFDFDNLNFKTGSAEITEESQHQIDNINAILKAFPKSKIKIGGYTDKTGDEAVNKKLSGDRASAVKAALAKAGTGMQVISAEGYGSDFAMYPAMHLKATGYATGMYP